MKLPRIKFTPETIVSLAANHGEKVLVAIALLCSLPLAWGGLNALRTQMLEQDKSPAQIENAATEAENQFRRVLAEDQQAKLAEQLRGPRLDADAAIAAWRVDEVGRPPAGLGLNRPLLGDIKKREAPTVFPLEQLRAVAGVTAIARREQEQGLPGRPGFGATLEPEAGEGQPAVQSPPATLVPYVLLTGLVPYRKQAEEYRSLFSTASFTDAERDVPHWSDFTVERQEVGASGGGPWQEIDLRQTVQRWGREWSGVAADPLPPEFVLNETDNPRDPAAMPVGFCGPLPQLAERPQLSGVEGLSSGPGSASWGLAGLHPWAVEELLKLRKLQEEEARQQQQDGGLSGLPFSNPGSRPGGQGGGGPTFIPFANEGMPGQTGMNDVFDDPLAGPDGMVNLLDYRLFRFLDTAVEPGKTYCYRVTIRLWNPNVGLPIKYLETPELAEAVMLATSPSELSPSVTSGLPRPPGRSRVVARLLTRDDKKMAGLGGSDNEALVLDANPDSGNFELHSAEIAPGQPIGIEQGARRLRIGNRRIAVPEHDVTTDLTVLGIAGEQELDEKKRITRGFLPPPPVELLLVNSNGAIDRVTAADSARTVQQYIQTLPGYMPPQPSAATQPEFR